MARSEEFVQKFVGARLLLPVRNLMREDMDIAAEWDPMTVTIATQYGMVDLGVLAAVLDKVLAEIEQDATILLRREAPKYRLHFAVVMLLRDEPGRVDPAYWIYQLTQRIVDHLRSN
jgi:hypothetical protein